MSDYISLEAAAKREKIKTPFARIVVNNNPEKNYYNIMWWQDGEMHVGFGSANLNFVRKWLSEEFEVASPPADVEPVRHGEWRLVRRMAACGEYECSVCGRIETFGCFNKPENNPYCHCGAKMDLEDETNDN